MTDLDLKLSLKLKLNKTTTQVEFECSIKFEFSIELECLIELEVDPSVLADIDDFISTFDLLHNDLIYVADLKLNSNNESKLKFKLNQKYYTS